MAWEPIQKHLSSFAVPPNLRDYARVCREFSWDSARRELHGLPGGGLNIAHEAVDRHARGAAGGRTAIRWIAKDGATRDLSYAELSHDSSRFANVLTERVGRLSPKEFEVKVLNRYLIIVPEDELAAESGCTAVQPACADAARASGLLQINPLPDRRGPVAGEAP